MRESKFIEEFQEEARVEARREGRHEGRLEKAREDVLRALGIKFEPAAAEEFASALGAITDSERLDQLFALAVQSTTFKQFREGFENA